MDDGDFGGEGGGLGIGFAVDVDAGIIAEGGEGGWTVGDSLYCISMFILNNT